MQPSTATSDLNYNKEFLVIQANDLVRSRQDSMSVLETKLIRLAISQIIENDTDFRTYRCNIKDLAEFLDISASNIYREMRGICASLLKKTIYIEDKERPGKKGQPNFKMFNWIDEVEYRDGTLTFRLSSSLKPYLLGLKSFYTLYGYEYARALPTHNAIRLFELLASWQISIIRSEADIVHENGGMHKNEITYSIEYLRQIFNCTTRYKQTGDFVLNVIDASVKAINKNTIMRIAYTPVKKGNRTDHITFTVNPENPEGAEEWQQKMDQVNAVLEGAQIGEKTL